MFYKRRYSPVFRLNGSWTSRLTSDQQPPTHWKTVRGSGRGERKHHYAGGSYVSSMWRSSKNLTLQNLGVSDVEPQTVDADLDETFLPAVQNRTRRCYRCRTESLTGIDLARGYRYVLAQVHTLEADLTDCFISSPPRDLECHPSRGHSKHTSA